MNGPAQAQLKARFGRTIDEHFIDGLSIGQSQDLFVAALGEPTVVADNAGAAEELTFRLGTMPSTVLNDFYSLEFLQVAFHENRAVYVGVPYAFVAESIIGSNADLEAMTAWVDERWNGALVWTSKTGGWLISVPAAGLYFYGARNPETKTGECVRVYVASPFWRERLTSVMGPAFWESSPRTVFGPGRTAEGKAE